MPKRKKAIKPSTLQPSMDLDEVGNEFQLDHKDNILLKHLIRWPSTTNEKLGELVGLSEKAVRNRRGKPEFERAYGELTASTTSHLKDAARMAAARIKQLIKDENKDIALQASKFALANHLGNKSQVDVNMAPRVIYKSSIQVDGSLLQEVIAEDVKKLESPGE